MVTLNGQTLDRFDADRLRDWVVSAEQEFTPEEHRRARKSVTYLRSRIRGTHSLTPRISLSSVINLVAVLTVLFYLMGMGHSSPLLAELHAEGSPGEIFQGTIMVQGCYLLTFLCFAALTVGWPKWIRVGAAIIGFVSLLWLFICGMVLIVSANGPVGGFNAFVFIGLIIWFIVLLARSGNR